MLTPVKLIARIQEVLMVAGANQLFKLSHAQALFVQIAEMQLESPPLKMRARLAAGRARGFLQKLDNLLASFPCSASSLASRLANWLPSWHRFIPQYRGTFGSISADHRSIPPVMDRAPSTPCERSQAAASKLRMPWWQNSTTSSAFSSRRSEEHTSEL